MMTGGGTGLLKPASGTWGSLPPVVLAFLIGLTSTPWAIHVAMAIIVIASSIVCIAYGPWAEQRWGRKDPGEVVIDEFAGQALTLLMIPWVWILPSISCLAIACGIAFIAFRILDILKPPPISSLQSLPAGWGVLVDDLLAGLLAGIACWILAWSITA